MFDPLAPLPLITAAHPGMGGTIKTIAEDFEVEEVPAYEPCGEGEHLFLWIQKREMGAEYFERQIAQRLGIRTEEVGTAGLKDRHAVTRQWVSVPARVEDRLSELEGDGIHLLNVSRHGNKLKSGHLRGNRFRILIRDVDPQARDRLSPLLDHLRQWGLPNFYGPQRFGHDGETALTGWAMLKQQPLPEFPSGYRPNLRSPFIRKLALSAVQSALFNRTLTLRMKDGLLHRVLDGDVMARWPAGGMFLVEDVACEQARFDAREIVTTGPMFGRKMYATAGQAADREEAILTEAGLTPQAFHQFGKLLSGTRRHNLIYLDDLTGTIEEEGIRIQVTLPAGSYATILLRELTHAEEDKMTG